MNQILDTDESVLAQGLFDDRVVVERDPLSGDLGVTSLVDEFLDGLEVGLTIGGGGGGCNQLSALLARASRERVGFSDRTTTHP